MHFSFKNFRGGPSRLQEEIKNDLRSHHYKFGDD